MSRQKNTQKKLFVITYYSQTGLSGISRRAEFPLSDFHLSGFEDRFAWSIFVTILSKIAMFVGKKHVYMKTTYIISPLFQCVSRLKLGLTCYLFQLSKIWQLYAKTPLVHKIRTCAVCRSVPAEGERALPDPVPVLQAVPGQPVAAAQAEDAGQSLRGAGAVRAHRGT